MDAVYRQRLERNIRQYSWYKIFTKRVYLPLIAIQLVNVGAVTPQQLAIIAIASTLPTLLLDIPTGYLADRLGNKFAIVTGSVIMTVSPLFYVGMPNFTGGLLAAVLFFTGYTFQSGAIEAFIHDTLVVLKRDDEYAKVLGHAQSYGLIGNVVLLVAVPATYTINHDLPFLLGFVAQSFLVALGLRFTYPQRHETAVKTAHPVAAIRQIVTRSNLPLFLFAGATLGVSYTTGNYRELVWQHDGIAVGIFGALVAVSSLIGAVIGRYLHVLDTVKPSSFYLYDLLFFAGFLVLAGITANPVIAAVAFIMLLGYDRVHSIVFQSKLLKDMHHTYKATLISALNVFSTIGQFGAALLLGGLAGLKGYQSGYMLFGLCVLAVELVLWLFLTAAGRRPPLAVETKPSIVP